MIFDHSQTNYSLSILFERLLYKSLFLILKMATKGLFIVSFVYITTPFYRSFCLFGLVYMKIVFFRRSKPGIAEISLGVLEQLQLFPHTPHLLQFGVQHLLLL